MKTFAGFLKPDRKRLRALTGQPEQLTIIFDAGASSRENLEDRENFVTAVRPSDHRDLLAEAAGQLAFMPLSNGAEVRAWRIWGVIAGKQRDVVVFSPQLHAGQLRGLHQSLARAHQDAEGMGLRPPLKAETAKRKLNKICGGQYLRSLLRHAVDQDEQGAVRVCLWSDWEEYRRLAERYFGLRVLITDRTEWSTAQIIHAYRGQSNVDAGL